MARCCLVVAVICGLVGNADGVLCWWMTRDGGTVPLDVQNIAIPLMVASVACCLGFAFIASLPWTYLD